jgi:hypothetical protein
MAPPRAGAGAAAGSAAGSPSPAARHLRALIWKNTLLMRRNWRASVLEVILPLACVGVMVALHSAFPLEWSPPAEFTRDATPVPPLAAVAARLARAKQSLCVVPASPAAEGAASSLAAWLAASYPGFSGSASGLTRPAAAALALPPLAAVLRTFPSEAALAAHIKADSYGEDGT